MSETELTDLDKIRRMGRKDGVSISKTGRKFSEKEIAQSFDLSIKLLKKGEINPESLDEKAKKAIAQAYDLLTTWQGKDFWRKQIDKVVSDLDEEAQEDQDTAQYLTSSKKSPLIHPNCDVERFKDKYYGWQDDMSKVEAKCLAVLENKSYHKNTEMKQAIIDTFDSIDSNDWEIDDIDSIVVDFNDLGLLKLETFSKFIDKTFRGKKSRRILTNDLKRWFNKLKAAHINDENEFTYEVIDENEPDNGTFWLKDAAKKSNLASAQAYSRRIQKTQKFISALQKEGRLHHDVIILPIKAAYYKSTYLFNLSTETMFCFADIDEYCNEFNKDRPEKFKSWEEMGKKLTGKELQKYAIDYWNFAVSKHIPYAINDADF